MARLLATDLDGTLLRPDGSVSERTVTALSRAREVGFPVLFVTGRPPREAVIRPRNLTTPPPNVHDLKPHSRVRPCAFC